MTKLTCPCGEVVSGPDEKAVTATMARHKAKKHSETVEKVTEL